MIYGKNSSNLSHACFYVENMHCYVRHFVEIVIYKGLPNEYVAWLMLENNYQIALKTPEAYFPNLMYPKIIVVTAVLAKDCSLLNHNLAI